MNTSVLGEHNGDVDSRWPASVKCLAGVPVGDIGLLEHNVRDVLPGLEIK